jgi:dephospho-CoA kinase
MPRFLLGLTGGMASGKSTVARWLAEAGLTVVDADRVVAELYAPGGVGAAAVRELFGDDVLNSAGGVDHPRLAAIVFSDDGARQRIEEAIHPLVRERFHEIATTTDGIVVLDATRLVEAGYAPDLDYVVSIESSFEEQLRRAVARGLDEASARARLKAQGDGELRRRAAHRILKNDGTLEELRRQVDTLVDELRPPRT